MKKQGMLKLENYINRSGSGRKFRKIKASRAMERLEIDIKVVWIPCVGKSDYLLAMIDVHTRTIVKDSFSFSIKQDKLIDSVFRTPTP